MAPGNVDADVDADVDGPDPLHVGETCRQMVKTELEDKY